jgi:hypothetical protein
MLTKGSMVFVVNSAIDFNYKITYFKSLFKYKSLSSENEYGTSSDG